MTSIRIIDFETTGLEPKDGAQVCEVGFCDLTQDGADWIVGTPMAYLCRVPSIPPEVRAIHHIAAAETQEFAPFDPAQLAESCALSNAVAAHNMDFELKFLGEPGRPTICTYKAALRVWPDAPSHSNGALRYWLQDQGLISPDADLCQPAHRAGPDTYVTAHILRALLKVATGREMIAWTKEPRLFPTMPIGKQKGAKWADVDAGFLGWIMRQPTMEEDIKWNTAREIARRAAQ